MPGIVLVKPGVTFPATVGDYKGSIAPAGFCILSAIDQASAELRIPLTITSGSDGCHSGMNDPHHSAEAYDLRTRTLHEDEKIQLLNLLIQKLGTAFFCFIEAQGTDNEHIHVQRKRDTTYPPSSNNVEAVSDAATGEK